MEVGDYVNAEPLFKRALQIYEKVLGYEHSDTALTLNNLSALYVGMNDFEKAHNFW